MFHFSYFSRQPLIAIVAGMLFASPAVAQNDYYFGDSDLEQGNAQIIAGQTAQDRAPYYCAEDLCRDSNGPVWAELLTPGVEASLAASEPYKSLNFAVSGAHMTERGDDDLPIATGVSTQIALFGALQDGGSIAVKPTDRFFIHAGTNDMLRILEGDDPALVRSDIVMAAQSHVSTLAARGARTIIVSQVQPVQYLPLLARGDQSDLRNQAAQFVLATNADLVISLGSLRRSLPGGTNIIMIDQPAFFENLRANYAKLGFSDFETACFDSPTGSLCSTDPAVQNRRVFFDSNHLSAAGHRLLADWVRATLAGASGGASLSAGRMSDALTNSSTRIATDTEAARRVMDGLDGKPFLFAAPIIATSRYRGDASTDLKLRQRGGLFGLQLPLGSKGYATVSISRLDQDARLGDHDRFSTSEWSITGGAGLKLGVADITVHGSYARPQIRDFRRDTGALGLIATASKVGAERYSAGIGAKLVHKWGDLQLSASSGLDYTHVRINGFSESEAKGLALHYVSQSSGTLSVVTSTRLGVAPVTKSNGIGIAPYIQLSDRSQLSGASHAVTSTLIDNIADSAVLKLSRLNDDGLRVGGGVDVSLAARIRLNLAYDHAVDGSSKRSHAVAARLAINF